MSPFVSQLARINSAKNPLESFKIDTLIEYLTDNCPDLRDDFRLISEKYSDIKIMTTFQSRFGPQEWLQPYTDKTFEALPKEWKKNI